ncbi:hypothetical protein LCGC14_1357890 [marine sediment metagenome]|uniref:Peptidase M15A C-terminal domain-containing protein n=1 Tax=marine sediment metagenome TaxID=412755 RepID=A0A0F9K8X7_9ZZZZ
MTVYYKDGVVGDLQPVAQKGLGRLDRAHSARVRSALTIVTSKRDGNHMAGSFHYIGLAFDVRPFEGWDKARYLKAFGHGWQVIVNNDYVHCEYDPK